MHTFIAKKGDGGASDDLARLRGARYVVTAETETNQPLAEALIKRVTGGDTITARHLYGAYFDYKPQFKIWMSTNNRPKISGGDKAIWRRLKEVPFLASFPAGDPKLPDALRAEAAGILAWAVRGYLDFQRIGLQPPKCVEQATQSYRDEMDIVGQFLSEQTVPGVGDRTPKGEAYKAFLQWTQENRTEYLSKVEFGRRLQRTGIKDFKSGSTHYWRGITLVASQELGMSLAAIAGSEHMSAGLEAW